MVFVHNSLDNRMADRFYFDETYTPYFLCYYIYYETKDYNIGTVGQDGYLLRSWNKHSMGIR